MVEKYYRQLNEVHLPTLAEKFNLTWSQATKEICKLWHRGQGVEENLIVETTNEPWYYEVCDTKYVRGNVIRDHEFKEYCESHQIKDQHISVYAHDQRWLAQVIENKKVSGTKDARVRVDVLWIELDRKDYEGNASLIKAMEDAKKIRESFPYPEHMSLFTSGNNSVHIAVNGRLFGRPILSQKQTGRNRVAYNLAHKIVGDVRHRNGIVDVYNTDKATLYEEFGRKGELQRIQRALENTDPNIYTHNSLIRLPLSLHEKTSKPKSLIEGNFEMSYTPPLLLDWYYECYNVPTRKKRVAKSYPYSYIIRVFERMFEDFDPDEADGNGWVSNLYSPFYEDTNPSVSVNIENGWYHDFGYQSDSLPFEEVLKRVDNG